MSRDRRLHLTVAINSTGNDGASWSWPGTRWNRFNDVGHYLFATPVLLGVLVQPDASDHDR